MVFSEDVFAVVDNDWRGLKAIFDCERGGAVSELGGMTSTSPMWGMYVGGRV